MDVEFQVGGGLTYRNTLSPPMNGTKTVHGLRNVAQLWISAAAALMLLSSCQSLPRTASVPLIRTYDNSLYVEARVNGLKMNCLVDSGAGEVINLDPRVAKLPGISPTSRGRTAWVDLDTMVEDGRAETTLELGTVTFRRRLAVIHSALAGDCVLGVGAMKPFIVGLDYAGAKLNMYQAGVVSASAKSHTIPFTWTSNPYVAANLAFPDGSHVDAHLVVDTGCRSGAAFLSKSFIEKNSVMRRVGPTIPDWAYGHLPDQSPKQLVTRLDRLVVGDIQLDRPVVALARYRGWGGGVEGDGMVCADFLRRYNTAFDFGQMKLLLNPGPMLESEADFDASGAWIYRNSRDEPYRVYRIAEGSPAAEAGLSLGDILLDMDGKDAPQLKQYEIVKARMASGGCCTSGTGIRRGLSRCNCADRSETKAVSPEKLSTNVPARCESAPTLRTRRPLFRPFR